MGYNEILLKIFFINIYIMKTKISVIKGYEFSVLVALCENNNFLLRVRIKSVNSFYAKIVVKYNI